MSVDVLADLQKEAHDRVAKAFDALLKPSNDAIAALIKLNEEMSKAPPETERIEAQDLEQGDVIVEWEGRKKVTHKVDEVEHSACASRGTHVNKKWCYAARAMVWVQN